MGLKIWNLIVPVAKRAVVTARSEDKTFSFWAIHAEYHILTDIIE